MKHDFSQRGDGVWVEEEAHVEAEQGYHHMWEAAVHLDWGWALAFARGCEPLDATEKDLTTLAVARFPVA